MFSVSLTYRPLQARSIEPTLAGRIGEAIPYVDKRGKRCIARLGKLHALRYFELPYFNDRLERYFPEEGEIGVDTAKGSQLLARMATDQTLLRQLYLDEKLNTSDGESFSAVGFELTDLDSNCGEPVVAGSAIKMAATPEKPTVNDKPSSVVTALLHDRRVLDSFGSARERKNAINRKESISVAYFHLAGQTFVEVTSDEIGCREAEPTDFALYVVAEAKGNNLSTLFARGTMEHYQASASLGLMTDHGLMLVWWSSGIFEIFDVKTGTARSYYDGRNSCPC